MPDDFDSFFQAQKAPAAPPSPVGDAEPTLAPQEKEFGSFFDDYNQAQDAIARRSLIDAQTANPDQAGRAMTLAPHVGVPAQAVEAELPAFEAEHQATQNSATLDNNPVLRRWLTEDPMHARIARDDFDKLDFLSKGVRALSSGWNTAFLNDTRGRLGNEAQLGGDVTQRVAAIDADIAKNPELNGVYGALQTVAGFAGGLVDNFFHAVPVAATSATAGGVVGGALTPEAGGVGAIPGAVAGGTIGFGVGFNWDMARISAGNMYLNLGAVQGENGATIDPDARQAAAILTGIGVYALGSIGLHGVGAEGASAARALFSEGVAQAVQRPTMQRALKEFAVKLGKSSVEGALIMSGMSAVELASEDMAKQLSSGQFATLFNDEATRQQALESLLYAAASGAVLMPFAHLPFAGANLYVDSIRAREAQTSVAALQSVMDGAAQSKTRGRNLDAFNSFIAMHSDGKPVDNVFIPGARLLELYQSAKVTPEAGDPLFGKIAPDIAQQLAQAKETGGDVVLPLAGYITHLAGSDIAKAVQNDLRLHPDGMTLREAETYAKERGKMLEENAVSESARREHEHAGAEPARQVYDAMFSKLREAGFNIDTSRQYSSLLASRYETRAERLGGTKGNAFDLFKAEGVDVRKQLPEALRGKNVDYQDMVIEAARRGEKMPSDRKLFGKTVVEAIRTAGGVFDEGGVLAAMDVGKLKETRGVLKKGEKLNAAHGSLDDMALRLTEMGYFPDKEGDRASIEEVVQAIRDEIGGNPRYAVGVEAQSEPQALFRDAVKDLEDFLGHREIDIKKASNAEIKKLLAEHAADQPGGREFDQGQYTRDQLERMDIDTLDRMAFGHVTGEELTLKPSQIKIKYPGDLANPEHKFERGGMDWVRSVKFDERVEVSIGKDGKFYLEDGHHRYFAAKKLGRALDAVITKIDGKPIDEILRRQSKGETFNQAERGKIQIDDGRAIITLFKDADLSTFLHESGHLFLEEFRRDYLDAAAPEQVRKDFEAVLKWLGAETPADISIEQHEQFARGFEAYLLEGKAPSTALARAFRSFRQWLTNIYKSLAGLNVSINDEMRAVFDRLIASDAEIEAKRQALSLNPVFATAKDARMTDAEFAAYTNKVAKAREDGDRKLLEKTMAAIRASRTAEWEREAEGVREEVSGAVKSRPDLRAEHWLRTGKMLDTGEPGTMPAERISKPALIDMYGNETVASMMPRSTLTAKGGMHPDDVAVMFGFRNGDDLVKALTTLEANRKMAEEHTGKKLGGGRYVAHLIDDATNEKMMERHGDALRDGSIEEEAIAALHNKAQADVMVSELRIISRHTGKRPLELADMRQWVDEEIAVMRVSHATDEMQHARSEARAGKEVERALLKGDFVTAFEAKQRQLFAHLMYVAAQDAKDDLERASKMFARFASKGVFKSISQDFTDRAHEILKRIGYATVRSDAELQGGIGGTSLGAWVADKEAQGYELLVPDWLTSTTRTAIVRDMPMDDLRGVMDAITTIGRAGRLDRIGDRYNELSDYQLLIDEASTQLADLPAISVANKDAAGAVIRSPDEAVNRMDAARAKAFRYVSAYRSVTSALRKIEELVDVLDEKVGANGLFNKTIFRPIAEAEHKANDMRKAVVGQWLKLRDGMSADWHRSLVEKRITTPELLNESRQPWSFTKSELLMIALNTGNESNLDKLLRGEKWDQAGVDAVLNRHLTAEDWKFVQGTWDIINSLWPQIEEMQRRLTGLGPEKIEARPFTNAHGSFAGGYFPVMYSAKLAADVEARARTAASKLLDEDYIRIGTAKGHTKKRVDNYARPLDLSFGRIAAHLDGVIHDLNYREPVMSIQRFMTNKDVRAGIIAAVGKENYDQFMPWLKHVVNERAVDQRGMGWWDGFARKVRLNATMVGLAFRMSTIMMQVAGFGDSAEMIGAKGVAQGFAKTYGFGSPLEAISKSVRAVSATAAGKVIGAKYLAMGFDAMSGHPRKFELAHAFVVQRSGEMRHRFETVDRDIRQGLQSLMGKGGALNEARRFGYYGIGMMDLAVTVPTWIGAYEKAMAEKMPEADAIYYADKVVRLSQGAGGAKDMAAVQRSHNEWFKLTTMFYHYMNHVINRQFSIARQARAGFKSARAGELKKAGYDFAMVAARSWWLLVVPPLLSQLLVGRGPGDEESVAGWAMRNILTNMWGGVPIARDVANVVAAKASGTYKSDYQLTPAERMGTVASQAGADAWNATFGDDPVSDKWVKHAVETSGYVFGLPGAGQAGTSLQYLWDVNNGDQQPDNAADFAQAMFYGPKKKD